MKHAMLDFETLSLKKEAVLLCCAVVLFDRERERISHGLWHIDLKEQVALGRDIDPETVCWWMQQSDEARDISFNHERERLPIAFFLHELREYLFWNNVERVWCKGPAADAAWLESLCADVGIDCPVHYRLWRDVRTQIDGREIEVDISDLVPHDPVADCIAQIREVRATWSH